MTCFLCLTFGIFRAPELPSLLGGKLHLYQPWQRWFGQYSDIDAVLSWGLKVDVAKACKLARRLQLPIWRLEDGFISYLGHPALGDRRFSLIVDKTGIYYDASQPSDLENLLNNPAWATPALEDRSLKLIKTIRTYYISKYNHEPVGQWCMPVESIGQPKVLVVDQTYRDYSVSCGMADSASFSKMLDAALQENPHAEVWVKVHPDVVLGTKQGYFQIEHGRVRGVTDQRVRVLAEKVNAQSLFHHFDKVYVVTSQLGFEALLHNRPVVCFGVPFYSGWGLTDDRVDCERRIKTHTLASLFAAACLLYTRYIDPETQEPCELEDALALIAFQRASLQGQLPRVQRLYALEFSFWKRAFVKDFVATLADEVVFVRSHRGLRKRLVKDKGNNGLLIWGQKPVPRGIGTVSVWRMEDGFIRSCGLGAHLRRPASLVLDDQGIYFDATTPSRLEYLLNSAELSPEQVQRGEALVVQLLAQRISKYNLTSAGREPFAGARPGQRRILVTGQVDSDASLKYGSPVIFRNIDLLIQVRQWLNDECIDAFVIYKPHPDVLHAGRQGHVPESEALQFADQVVSDCDIFDCISQSDELHVMTSLSGFEALLQNKTVHCWGIPFYAGWGLTHDHIITSAVWQRRQRRRDLAELVYLSLCQYPRYIHWQTRRLTMPERVIAELARQRTTVINDTGWFARKYRKIQFLLEAIRT